MASQSGIARQLIKYHAYFIGVHGGCKKRKVELVVLNLEFKDTTTAAVLETFMKQISA